MSLGRPAGRWAAVVAISALASACGQKAPGSPSGQPPASATLTITSTGVQPKNVDIALGNRVLFVNSDTRSHSIGSDPHPEHTDCPSINQVGFVVSGQSRETGNFVTARVCAFHDHDDQFNQGLWGTITTR